jgi:hypothetical protein
MLLALNLTIGLGHFLVLFNTGAYLPMIPRVAGSLGVDPVYVDWTQANFFLAMALAFPTAAWFLNRWGEMRSLLGAFLASLLRPQYAQCLMTMAGFWHHAWCRGMPVVSPYLFRSVCF